MGADQVVWRDLRAQIERFVARRVGSRYVEDVVQEVFVRVSRGLPDLRQDERLGAWVYRIARNTIIDFYRRPQSQREEPTGFGVEQAVEIAADDAAAATALSRVLEHFVHLLPPRSRQALELTELDGITQAEAAQRLGLSVPGMKSRVQRARAQLRELLERCCDIELDVRGRVLECEPRRPPAHLPSCCAGPRP